jgi:hypothetical protein
MDPRTPHRPDYVQEIMDRGIEGLSSSDSVEEAEYSEATKEKLEDLAAMLYRAHGPKRKHFYNSTGRAKHGGSDVFPDLDVDKWVAGVMQPLLDQVARRRKAKEKAAMLRRSGYAPEAGGGGGGVGADGGGGGGVGADGGAADAPHTSAPVFR